MHQQHPPSTPHAGPGPQGPPHPGLPMSPRAQPPSLPLGTPTMADKKGGDESELYSEEYYAAQKAKRQGLGLIKFIGELFKLQMLTERIMHECVKKLLGNVENPEEGEIESLCQLLKTVGQLLDVPKARMYMDVYFSRMKELCKSTNVSSRMQFMLQVVGLVLLLLLFLSCRQDVIELRERKWQPRNVVNAPATLAQVHEAVCVLYFFPHVYSHS